MVVTLGQHYHDGEKPTVKLYLHLHYSPCRNTKQNKDNRHDEPGLDNTLQIQNLFMAFKRFPDGIIVTLSQQYHVGEKPAVILYTYITRHAGTLSKTKTKDAMSLDYSSLYVG